MKVKDLLTDDVTTYESDFVFIGAGGASYHLQKQILKNLNTSAVSPVSGIFLVCQDPEIVEQHDAKVYGKASRRTSNVCASLGYTLH